MEIKIVSSKKYTKDSAPFDLLTLELNPVQDYLGLSEDAWIEKYEHGESLLDVAKVKGKSEFMLKQYLSRILKKRVHAVLGDSYFPVEKSKEIIHLIATNSRTKGWIVLTT
jgi:hypothetical protein